MAVLVLLLFLTLTTEVLSQGERATLPLTLRPRPLKGGCPSQDEISEIHDEVRSVLQDTVEPIRRQAVQDLNGTNSSESTHCWVDHSNGDTQHCFSEEQWNKLQDDIKEGIYTELQGKLLTTIQEMLQNTTEQIQNDFQNEIMQVQESLHQIQGDLNQTEIEHSNDITQVQESLHHIQSDLNQTEIEHSNDITQLESRIIKVPGTCKELAAMNPSLPSGYYSIKNDNGTLLPMYCDIPKEGCGNGTGGWTRVAYRDMMDPIQQCPSAWREITYPIRTCGRGTDIRGCDSVILFSTNGMQYSNVVGRVVGYQYGQPEAFPSASKSINNHYLDGVSITRGTS